MAASVLTSAYAKRRNPAPRIQIPSKASTDWQSNYSDNFVDACIKRRGSNNSPSDSSSPSPDVCITYDTDRPKHHGVLRQNSLPTGCWDFGIKSSVIEPKGILKRSSFTSGTLESFGSYSPGYESMNVEFLEAFRSVDDLFSASADEISAFRKRVSFSEKIIRNTYRPGACILQQKLKAQKKREKRNSKDGRRTASESDAGDLTSLTDNLESLSCSRHNDSDSGLEMECSPSLSLEEVVEAEEDVWNNTTTSNSRKKKRNRKNRKNKVGEH